MSTKPGEDHLLVHHMNAAGEKPRGHTSILANLDSVLICRKVEGAHDADKRIIRELTLAKAKDGESDGRWRFVLPSVEIGSDEDGDPVTSCVVALPRSDGSEDATDEKGIFLSDQAKVLLRAIYKALEKYGERPPLDLTVSPAPNRVVAWPHVRAEFEALTLEGAQEDDPKKRDAAIRKALSRHGDSLLSKGVIGRSSPWIWLGHRKVRGFRPLSLETALSTSDESLTAPFDGRIEY